jgi:hypothetical protein
MSNQRKAEFVNGNFGIQSFWKGHGKNSSNPDLDQKAQAGFPTRTRRRRSSEEAYSLLG